jgi:hypothetical protein
MGQIVPGFTTVAPVSTPITWLNATLERVPPPGTPGGATVKYLSVVTVSSTNPLLAGQSAQTTGTFIGPDFENGLHYPLTISGTLKGET